MPLRIPVAHDFSCPWCWIGFQQVLLLQDEFDVAFEWLSYELMPENLPWDPPSPRPEIDPRRPATPGRLALAYAASGVEVPTVPRPRQMRTHNALESVEWTKEHADPDSWVGTLYRSHWEDGQDINELDVLARLARREGLDSEAMMNAVNDRAYDHLIVKFDDNAYQTGVFNVPTFFIAGERYAEQPIAVLRRAIAEAMTAV